MKTFLILSLLVALSLAKPAEDEEEGDLRKSDFKSFKSFKLKYEKNYETTAEEIKRFEIFRSNLKEINDHNKNHLNSYEKGINQFSDLTQEEFEKIGFGYVNIRQSSGLRSSSFGLLDEFWQNDDDIIHIEDLPREVDWRKRGAVTPVKNQGNCGSCWAHGAVETIESYLKINNPHLNLTELSVQQITSCAPNPDHCGGTGGCYGSIPQLGFVYAQLYGLNTADQYPYVSGNSAESEKCLFDAKKKPSKVTLRGYEILPRNNMKAFMKHLAYKGPLAISVAASDLKSYSNGIYDGCSFDSDIVMNHEIQLVGYGTDKELGDYWLARNSWGPHWGEEGFIRFKRNKATHCGFDRSTADGSACAGDGMDVQHVCGECGLLYEGVYPIGVSLKDDFE